MFNLKYTFFRFLEGLTAMDRSPGAKEEGNQHSKGRIYNAFKECKSHNLLLILVFLHLQNIYASIRMIKTTGIKYSMK